jgi:hypothetical protein
VFLPMRCGSCYVIVTLEVRLDISDFAEGSIVASETYVCPWCHKENKVAVAGRLEKVAGAHPSPTLAERVRAVSLLERGAF